jgi:uncharacterized protein YpmB
MEEKTSIGSVIATIIIIALIVLGGLYFWGKRIEQEQATQSFTPTTNVSVVDQNQTLATTSPLVSTTTTTSTKSTKK